ncbi:hypothetical protein LSAT2_008500 [Lamellibrachia satsuma]|nr:hypothetical protein LSAT2_008500 [Lamellibrachia satsuma]
MAALTLLAILAASSTMLTAIPLPSTRMGVTEHPVDMATEHRMVTKHPVAITELPVALVTKRTMDTTKHQLVVFKKRPVEATKRPLFVFTEDPTAAMIPQSLLPPKRDRTTLNVMLSLGFSMLAILPMAACGCRIVNSVAAAVERRKHRRVAPTDIATTTTTTTTTCTTTGSTASTGRATTNTALATPPCTTATAATELVGGDTIIDIPEEEETGLAEKHEGRSPAHTSTVCVEPGSLPTVDI